MPSPKVVQVSASREDLPARYREVVAQNPLLGRVEGECRTIGWSDEEVRTLQLLLACKSNASLTKRLLELERSLAVVEMK